MVEIYEAFLMMLREYSDDLADGSVGRVRMDEFEGG